MPEELKPAQQEILAYLKRRMREGVIPSVREICAATGIKSTSSVHTHLNVLEEKGFIIREQGHNRSIRLTDETPVSQVPLLGKVTAGMPIYAHQEVTAYIPFPADRDSGGELFALRVAGDSMVNAGILDGDIIIAEKTASVHNGEIVVAMIEDSATVKRIYREKGCIRLQPENDSYDPILAREVTVLGRVVANIRYYG